jgi:hypothetical protein
MSTGENLTAEEQAELAEAVAAEQAAQDVPRKFQKFQECMRAAHTAFVDLCGTADHGALAYFRNKGIEKLEECMHRGADAMFVLRAENQRIEQAVADVQSGKLKLHNNG